MTEMPLKATLKSGAGYDAPWLTVDGANAADLAARLDDIISGDVVEKLLSAANLLKAANNAAPLVDNAPAQSAPAAPPVQQQGWGQPAAPAANGGVTLHPTATCGACQSRVQEKVITSKKNGKTYKMWVCPNQRNRDDGHYSEFQD